jgi:outer membrane receptor protein involved in Fe transport
MASSMLIVVWVSAVGAQEAKVEPGAGALDEIIVTAQKHEENVNDVGMTITAFTGDTLRHRQINSVEDFSSQVPSLSYANSPNNTPIYTLRGVGFYDASLAGYPTVTMYTDEVPLPFPALWNHAFFDLERVEVLKGPQGTLFGENATGGAINNVVAKPTDQLDAGGSLTFGRFSEAAFEGFISGPITDQLKGRIAFRSEARDGWQVSNTRPDDRNGKLDNFMVRALLDYKPVDALRLALSVTAWKDRSDTQAPQFIGVQSAIPGVLNPDLAASPFSPQTPRAADWTPGDTYADNDFKQLSIRVEADLNKELQLTSLTSYLRYDQRQGEDLDGLAIPTFDNTADIGKIETFFQELRLSYKGSGPASGILGLNFEKSTVNQMVTDVFPQSSANQALAPFGYPLYGGNFGSAQSMKNEAIFANFDYELGRTLTIKSGARYTRADRKDSNCTSDPFPPYYLGRYAYDLEVGGRAGPFTPGACILINNVVGQNLINPPAIGLPGRFQDELNEHNISWRFGPDWKITPDTLLYLSASKGYKAGSFPTTGGTLFAQYLPVRQESVLAYEGGIKATLADGHLQLNGALFYYDYKDKQLTAKLVDPTFGILGVLQNVPKSTVQGVDFDLTAAPIEGLRASLAATFVHAEIKQFVGINAVGVAGDFAGTRIPFAPKWQLRADLDYEFWRTNRINAFVGGGASYSSSTIAVVGGDRTPTAFTSGVSNSPYVIDAYTLVNLRAGLEGSDHKWRMELWGKNVFNKYYWTNISSATDTLSRYTGMPATYGVTVTFRH